MNFRQKLREFLDTFVSTQQITFALQNKENIYSNKVTYGSDNNYWIAVIKRFSYNKWGDKLDHHFTIKIDKKENVVKLICSINSSYREDTNLNSFLYRNLFLKLSKEGFHNKILNDQYVIKERYCPVNTIEITLDSARKYDIQLINLFNIIGQYNDYMYVRFIDKYYSMDKFKK